MQMIAGLEQEAAETQPRPCEDHEPPVHGSGEALSRFLTETGLEPGRILVRGCQDDDFVGREPS